MKKIETPIKIASQRPTLLVNILPGDSLAITPSRAAMVVKASMKITEATTTQLRA